MTLALQTGEEIIISFFPVEHSIACPEHLWFEVIASSLRMKKSVLILEEKIPLPERNPSARWEVGPKWISLTPRSLGPIVQSYGSKFTDFPSFKQFLSTSK